MPPPAFRFAPSPNGELHLGHAYSALFTQREARAAGGRLLLRIEDIDTVRCRDVFVTRMLDDLAWLGFAWDEPPRRQSRHMADYITSLDRLERLGLLYACFCTRRDLAGSTSGCDPDGAPLYSGRCRLVTARERLRRMTAGEPYALRLAMARALAAAGPDLRFTELGCGPAGETGDIAAEPARWGDVVLARKDIGTSYHIACVTDDALQGITHVTRGHDLFHATSVHRLLQQLLELPVPVYHHHRLIADDAGRKLSKSDGARSLRALREAGVTAAAIRDVLGF